MSAKPRWYEGVSMPRLIFGTVGSWVVCIAAAWYLLSPGFDAIERTVISGEVVGHGSPMLGDRPAFDLLVRGYPVRFRVSAAVVEYALKGRLPESLTSGTVAELIVPRHELESPSRPPIDPVPTVSIDAFTLDGRTVLHLEESKKWDEQNRWYAAWLMLIFAIISGICTTALTLRLRRAPQDSASDRVGLIRTARNTGTAHASSATAMNPAPPAR
jgi:hypothetical protein